MKLPVLLLALLLPLGALAQESETSPSPSAAPRGPGGPGGRGGPPREHSPLEDEMNKLQRSYRTLNRQYADPAQKTSSSELVDAMQKNLEKAKALLPARAGKLTGDEKDKYLATYAKDLDTLGKELADLKVAIDTGDNEKAKAILDGINKLKNTSHKELGVDDGGGRGGRGGGPRGPRGDQRPPSGTPAPSASASPAA